MAVVAGRLRRSPGGATRRRDAERGEPAARPGRRDRLIVSKAPPRLVRRGRALPRRCGWSVATTWRGGQVAPSLDLRASIGYDHERAWEQGPTPTSEQG